MGVRVGPRRRRITVRVRYHAQVVYSGNSEPSDTVNTSDFDYDGGRLEDYIERFDSGVVETHAPQGATAIWAQFLIRGSSTGGLRYHPGPKVYSRRWQSAFAADDLTIGGAIDPAYFMLPKEAPDAA